MPPSHSKEQEGVITKEKVRTKEPPMYRVILLNDDYTTMEFVVHILETVFHKAPPDAERIMMQVHKNGRGAAGIFTKEAAETKIALVHARAKQNEFPLKCTMEPA